MQMIDQNLKFIEFFFVLQHRPDQEEMFSTGRWLKIFTRFLMQT
jgi:hypothetical protein